MSPAPFSFSIEGLQRGSNPSSMLGLPVSLPSKLRVTGAQTENMSFHLRILLRVLSSWVHRPLTRGTGSLARFVAESRVMPAEPMSPDRAAL